MTPVFSDWSRSALTAALVGAVMVGAGCSGGSSGTSDGSASASPSASSASASALVSASATSTSTSASDAAGLPAPVIVTPSQTRAVAQVGETIVFNQPDPANTKISTDRPDVLKLFQGRDDGSAQFNPGAKALAPGAAVVTIEAADGSTEQVTVTVR